MIFGKKKFNLYTVPFGGTSGTEITFTFMHLAEAKQLALHLRYTVYKFMRNYTH